MARALFQNGRAMHLNGVAAGAPVDVGIDADGRVLSVVAAGPVRQTDLKFDRVIDLERAWVSPAWIDLHVHCYWGATWLSIRPELVGPPTGVGCTARPRRPPARLGCRSSSTLARLRRRWTSCSTCSSPAT